MPELVWNGKYKDGNRVEPSRAAAPLETDEISALPRAAALISTCDPDRVSPLLGATMRVVGATFVAEPMSAWQIGACGDRSTGSHTRLG